jgi:uncharacterized RDD family membrane protein YckC
MTAQRRRKTATHTAPVDAVTGDLASMRSRERESAMNTEHQDANAAGIGTTPSEPTSPRGMLPAALGVAATTVGASTLLQTYEGTTHADGAEGPASFAGTIGATALTASSDSGKAIHATSSSGHPSYAVSQTTRTPAVYGQGYGWPTQPYSSIPAGLPYPTDPNQVLQVGAIRREDLADAGPRLGAFLLDWFLLGVPLFVLGLIAGATNSTALAGPWLVLSMVVPAVYFVACWASTGRTVGYKALGLQLVRSDGSQLDVGSAIARFLAICVGFFFFLLPGILGALWMLWDSKKQTWADKIDDTVVLKRHRQVGMQEPIEWAGRKETPLVVIGRVVQILLTLPFALRGCAVLLLAARSDQAAWTGEQQAAWMGDLAGVITAIAVIWLLPRLLSRLWRRKRAGRSGMDVR